MTAASDASSASGINAGQEASCEDPRCDGSDGPIWHCVDCASNYCETCWPLQGPHRAGKLGRDGVPHEKTDLRIVSRLKGILQPSDTIKSLQDAHDRDTVTKWFGVTRNPTGRIQFEDYGRYAALMSAISPTSHQVNRYPQLVSFIGVTNAGKSTLIKMLISRATSKRASTASNHPWPAPVVGSVLHDTIPTSGDVNLYADPASHNEALPILYADCEGFEGGERTPLGAMARRKPDAESSANEAPKVKGSNSRLIEWANTDETRQREFAVKELYPRLLYTFSDTVVFVLRNPKTFQSAVLNRLLDWGAASLEKSINQPALPHAIVVLNATDPGVDDREWDSHYSTQSLLSSVQGALDYVEGVPKLRKLAEFWKGLGKSINTVEDLILRYYSSFQVIRVPAKPRYMKMDEQIEKLQAMIECSCHKSFHAKRRARMLTNADELNVYFQAGFNHFTAHLDVPFNFVEVSLRTNPIPYDFGGHILQLATTVAAQYPRESERVVWLFEKLAVMLASCVMLDCARFRKGNMEDLFGNYEQFFDWALAEFFELHWPCSYRVGDRRCALVKARHEVKGHQDSAGIIAAGEYQADFTVDIFTARFKEQLKTAISTTQRDFYYESDQVNQDNEHVPDESIALSLHKEYISQFFATFGASSLISHSSCFSCLFAVPEHPLPCGHVICHACLKAFGKPTGKSTITLSSCPLHPEETRWNKSPQIHLKPNRAGVRVLCLDGGGVRGVVQIEVLREIEQVLGNHLPIQAFFDLIVGTGTGGVIAAALGIQQKPISSETADMFYALCEVGYAPRVRGLPLLKLAAVLGGGSRYKTKPLRKGLEMAFGSDGMLFGGTYQSKVSQPLKVAVTSTTATGRGTVLLANYRRREDHAPFYEFERPHEPHLELKVWEAMAATTAAPSYFQPFISEQTHRTYIDGAVNFVNPAAIAEREWRLIWPDQAHREPDIFLSLGTGQNRYAILSKLSEYANGPAMQGHSKGRSPPQRSKTLAVLRQAAGMLSNRSDDVLEAEIAWSYFKAGVSPQADSSGRRYIRFNPDLDQDPPPIDCKADVNSLQQTVRKRLWLPHRQAALEHVGYRLIASSFYFDVTHKRNESRTTIRCFGSICCRFDDPEHLKSMGRFLRSKQTSTFQPHFLVKNTVPDTVGIQIPITAEMIDDMIRHGTFSIDEVELLIKDQTKASSITLFLSEHDNLEPEGFSISGFPQELLIDHDARRKRAESGSKGSSNAAKEPKVRGQRSEKWRRQSVDDISLNRVKAVSPTHDMKRPKSPTEEFTRRPSIATIGSSAVENKPSSTSSSSNTPPGPRTNRFWSYIGPQHMARHPERYTAQELQKFAGDLMGDLATQAVEVDTDGEFHELATSTERIELEGAETSTSTKSSSSHVSAGRKSIVSSEGSRSTRLEIPPPFPVRTRGFEPGELESAIADAELEGDAAE